MSGVFEAVHLFPAAVGDPVVAPADPEVVAVAAVAAVVLVSAAATADSAPL